MNAKRVVENQDRDVIPKEEVTERRRREPKSGDRMERER
jgi:hypothetical protein